MTIVLATAKAHLRVDHTDEDTLITSLISAGYLFAENYTNRVINAAEKVLKLHDFEDKITLEYAPFVSLTSIAYTDENGDAQTTTDYYLDDRETFATLQPLKDEQWPETDESYENVVITYQAGYSSIPQQIEQAVLLIIGSLYEQRENHIIGMAVNKIPVSAEYLLNPYKIITL